MLVCPRLRLRKRRFLPNVEERRGEEREQSDALGRGANGNVDDGFAKDAAYSASC